MSGDIIKAGGGRIWTIRYRAGPTHVPYYHSHGIAGAPDWGLGDVTKIEVPSDTQYNQWDQVDDYQNSPDPVTITLTTNLETSRSEMLDLVQLRCPFDAQVHFGDCENPLDFNFGWSKIYVYERARATSYKTSEQGAMEGGDQAKVMEDTDISARDLYVILRIGMKSVQNTLVSEELVAIDVCDSVQCGTCDTPSDGCSKVYAVSNPASSSPGILPQVILTDDGYATAIESVISTIALAAVVTDAECVGIYYVVLDSTGNALHYAELSDLQDATETWVKVTTGFVATKTPNAIWSYSPLSTWIVGNGGYIYFTDDPTEGVTVQDAGATTTNNLLDVAGYNNRVVVAVGASNTVVYTEDGGATWTSVIGPDPVGVPSLNAVGLRNENEWWVGGNSGRVWWTTDKGVHWTESVLKGTPTAVKDIKWASETVGYIATIHAGPLGKIQRTISGGNFWYIAPETPGQSIPTNVAINQIALCDKEVNKLFAAGKLNAGGDGILVKIADLA